MVEFVIPRTPKGRLVAAVYKMSFDCGSFYIGSSINIKQRMRGWKFKLETGVRKNLMVLAAFNKTTKVVFELIEVVANPSQVKIREDFHIKNNWGNELLLNRCPNAFDNFGSKHSPGRKKRVDPAKNRQKIAKVDAGGNVIEIYESITEAGIKNGAGSRGVSRVLKKYGLKCKGLIFRKVDTNGNLIVPPVIPNNPKKSGYKFSEEGKRKMREAKKKRIELGIEFISPQSKKVVQMDKQGNEIAIHDSIRAATRAVGCNDSRRLSKLLNGRRGKSINGFYFRYA